MASIDRGGFRAPNIYGWEGGRRAGTLPGERGRGGAGESGGDGGICWGDRRIRKQRRGGICARGGQAGVGRKCSVPSCPHLRLGPGLYAAATAQAIHAT
ncbi:hypothetical protein CALCODRAFT_153714 [Calocera cornea HHB12733]|uniref:Uncharacterized protein n=1 Tax=Calocera cornea HHB12733 TaxID=1353952 RepID=A0A165CMP8_9BASI|nr:hypothetical protein CALCODRAFT_153714 [Calocera cornea HHB12733]